MPRDSAPEDKGKNHGLELYHPAFARTGIGYDSHRFVPGKFLVLGGVSIPSSVSLIGHSDADAVAHALIDAILGGAAAGDIGEMFPDTADENAGRNSIEMLRETVERVRELGFIVHQADITVIGETPAIAPHRTAMRAKLAGAMGISPDHVSVKGKTNEGMGWIGRGEGLACIAVASLVPVS
jgi:2-C-methyl-D-erythritol 2,4-cyclodiphosphate synthase